MSFLKVLGQIGKVGAGIAPVALTAINPAAGAITSLVLGAVIKAEETQASGPEKRQQVIQQLAPLVGPMVSTIAQAAGSKLTVNPEGVNKAVGQMVDGVVALLNALQAPAAASASGADASASAR